MQFERTKNVKRNIVWGTVNRVILLLFPFLIRTIIIYKLGETYVGLNGLFSSILSLLSLTELGFSTAIVTVMYKSVAVNDEQMLCALLGYIRRVYYGVGTLMMVIGLLSMPLFPHLIHDYESVPSDINIYFIFLGFLLNMAIGYFCGGYSYCVLTAHQRQDKAINANSFVTILFSTIEVLILLLTGNYYLYLTAMVLCTFCIHRLTLHIARREYPNIRPVGILSREQKNELRKMITGTFMTRIGEVMSVAFDNAIISKFLGLSILAYYTNYAYIITSLQGFLVVIYTSMQPAMGNAVEVDSVEDNHANMTGFTFLYDLIVGWTSICLFFLLTPFVRVWLHGKGILPVIVVAAIVLNYYVTLMGAILGSYKIVLRIWWEDRFRNVIGGLFNLCLNVAMVLLLRRFGDYYALCGVVMSTVIASLLIQTPWEAYITFKMYFKKGMGDYFGRLFFYFMVTLGNIAICYPIMNRIDGLFVNHPWGILIGRGIACCIVPTLIYCLVYFRYPWFRWSVDFVTKRILKRSPKA